LTACFHTHDQICAIQTFTLYFQQIVLIDDNNNNNNDNNCYLPCDVCFLTISSMRKKQLFRKLGKKGIKPVWLCVFKKNKIYNNNNKNKKKNLVYSCYPHCSMFKVHWKAIMTQKHKAQWHLATWPDMEIVSFLF
jgi:hypothetical protein